MMVTRALRRLLSASPVIPAALALASPSEAAQPEPWQMGLQPAASPIMEMMHAFNNGILIVMTVIVVFVLALLLWCIVRFNAKANPVPSRTTHNTLIEVVWTVAPILILVAIAVPSFSLLFAEHDPARAIAGWDPETDPPLTIKATGNQWFWSYEYPDNGGVAFDSIMMSEEERAANPEAGPRLLAVDNQLVVPVGRVVRVQVIGADVIHAFAVPAFGVKIDAVPGRLNETWFRADREGVYYGQCSELCGRDHAFMPIAVRAVSPEAFEAWATAAATNLEDAYQRLAATTATAAEPVALAAGE